MNLQQIIVESCILKLKSRKYDESYLSFSFTSVTVNSEERPQCVLCLSILIANSINPDKLKWHLETKHSQIQNEPEEYFVENLLHPGKEFC
jgi:hypothetical protein